MEIYHGTTYLFDKPNLEKSYDRRDFGLGFYTTIIYEQSKVWSYRRSLRENKQNYYVNKYEFYETEKLNIKKFDDMNLEWLELIKENRNKGGLQHDYDIVMGPVADDNTMETIQLYINNILTASEAIERLCYFKVNNQISFHTEKALSYLEFIGRDEYARNI